MPRAKQKTYISGPKLLAAWLRGADRDLVKIWQKMNAKRFDSIMLKTKTVSARTLPEGIEVTFAAAEEGEAGGNASVAPPAPQVSDLVLQPWAARPTARRSPLTRLAWP